MSAVKAVTLHCDMSGCNRQFKTGFPFETLARKAAKANGWTTAGRGERGRIDHCPRHSKGKI